MIKNSKNQVKRERELAIMDKKVCQRLNEQRLDGIKYKVKNKWVYVKRPGQIWLPIDPALYYAMRNIIQAGY